MSHIRFNERQLLDRVYSLEVQVETLTHEKAEDAKKIKQLKSELEIGKAKEFNKQLTLKDDQVLHANQSRCKKFCHFATPIWILTFLAVLLLLFMLLYAMAIVAYLLMLQ